MLDSRECFNQDMEEQELEEEGWIGMNVVTSGNVGCDKVVLHGEEACVLKA